MRNPNKGKSQTHRRAQNEPVRQTASKSAKLLKLLPCQVSQKHSSGRRSKPLHSGKPLTRATIALQLHRERGTYICCANYLIKLSTNCWLVCPWQMATASASAASSGRGMSDKRRILFVIYCIWCLSAPPVPVSASFICIGVYS